MYEGIIREKPSSKEEAREFIKGLLNGLHFHLFSKLKLDLSVSSLWVAGYSGGQAAVVGSVLVTNLKTGKRKGGWERAEVLLASTHIFACSSWSVTIRWFQAHLILGHVKSAFILNMKYHCHWLINNKILLKEKITPLPLVLPTI